MPALLVLWEGNTDAQFISETSYLLTKYVSKYGTKGEKSTLDFDFKNIQSNDSVCSRLWSFSLRALNHRECGAIEAADTLLGHPLYATDSGTNIRWLDVRMIRSRRLKSFNIIKQLEPESTDIFYDSFIDTYYPNRPKKLESMSLYDFAKWFDIIKKKPIYKAEYYEIEPNLFCKKRKKPYLINHWKYSPLNQPEAYYYSLLLLFKPWRDTNELKGDADTYANAFFMQKDELAEAMKYHDKCSVIREAMAKMNEMIEQQLLLENQSSKPNSINLPEGCVPVELENAMKDFKDIVKMIPSKKDLEESISKFNKDQARVFEKITSTLQSNNILRIFISGPGGTGKSFIIENLVFWNKIIRDKETAVTAPTGIAAFNIQGLTVHRLLQLPVEHGCTAKYKELSNAALKQIRESLLNVDLIIIDEISMISNVILTYIHLRLTEIFDTSDCDDGWFGRKHIILFGDLLQLPPVNENFPFIELTNEQVNKYIGAMNSFNLWNLFEYDELTINMRQKDDKQYCDILSRIRLGFVTDSDINVLCKRKLSLNNGNGIEAIEQLCSYLSSLSSDTVCLLPTKIMCNDLNTAMLSKIDSEEIKLVAKDSFKCSKNLEKKVRKLLYDDDNACGVEREITIKINCTIMIRRNIDVSIGLVNGTIGSVISICKDKDEITNIRIKLRTGEEHLIPRLEYKFIVMDKIFIIRQQFPICNSYGITIHKSQGLSLENAVVEAGSSIFSCGQTYVALSRVTKIEGLHLINFDPSRVMADASAVLEYNRLRQKYRKDLQPFNIPDKEIYKRRRKIHDTIWSVSKNILAVNNNENLNYISDNVTWKIVGLPNKGGCSLANVCLQSLFHSPTIRRILVQYNGADILKDIFNQYISRKNIDFNLLSLNINDKHRLENQQDVAEYLKNLCDSSTCLKSVLQHELCIIIRCPACDSRSDNLIPNYILSLRLPEPTHAYKLQEVIDYNIGYWKSISEKCIGCKCQKLQKIDINITNTLLIMQLSLFSFNESKTFKVSNFKINEIPKTIIVIKNKKYKVISAILHHGNNINSGYYSNMLLENKQWFQVRDLDIKQKKWPSGAKDVYLLFLEQK